MSKFHLVTEARDLMILSKGLLAKIPRSSMICNVLRLKFELEAAENDKILVDIFAYNKCVTLNDENLDYFIVSKINVQGLPKTLLVMYANNSPSREQIRALEELIDWSEMNQFEGIENNISDFIKELCNKYGRGQFHDTIDLYFMNPVEALRFEETQLPESLVNQFAKVSVLKPSDAGKINGVWPAAFPGSQEMIQTSIELVGSGGVCIGKDADGNDTLPNKSKASELCSWAVALPFGSIHALHTEQDYQRRGYGALTMQIVSKSVASAGRIPVVQIFRTNDTSKSVNLRVGFQLSHEINLIHYFPLNE